MLLFDDQRRLTEHFQPEQAEVLAHILERQAERQTENLATKADIALIQKDIELLRQDMQLSNEGLRKDTRLDLEALRQETSLSLESLRKEMKELELKLTQRMFAGFGAVIAILGFLIKF